MIPYKKHPFIKGGFQVPRGIMPRGIIGPRSIVRKGPVREGEILPSHFFNKVFPIWPKTERITIPYKSPPKAVTSTTASNDSGLIGAGMGAILSILLSLM